MAFYIVFRFTIFSLILLGIIIQIVVSYLDFKEKEKELERRARYGKQKGKKQDN